MRLLQPASATDVKTMDNSQQWKVFSCNKQIVVNNLKEPAYVYVFDTAGHLQSSVFTKSAIATMSSKSAGIRIVKISSEDKEQVSKILVE